MRSPLPGFKAQKTQKPGSEKVQWLFLSTKHPFPLIQTGRGEPVNYRIKCVIINYKYKQKKGNYNNVYLSPTTFQSTIGQRALRWAARRFWWSR